MLSNKLFSFLRKFSRRKENFNMFEKALHLPSRQALYGASPWEAISRFFKRGFIFNGFSSRSEYWWVFAFLTIGSCLVSAVDNYLVGEIYGVSLGKALSVIVFIPFLALLSRRIQDAGLPGSLVLLFFIPFIGTIPLLIMTFLPSSRERLSETTSPTSSEHADL